MTDVIADVTSRRWSPRRVGQAVIPVIVAGILMAGVLTLGRSNVNAGPYGYGYGTTTTVPPAHANAKPPRR